VVRTSEPMRVLLVEDDRRMAELVSDYLTEDGIDTSVAHDGDTGLEQALLGDFDAVLLDLMLPGIGGIDVCRRLRAERSGLPIVILTARGSVRDRLSSLDAGASDYLVKPIALAELEARLLALWGAT
jgi:DNA-binding response OmpR family regulator